MSNEVKTVLYFTLPAHLSALSFATAEYAETINGRHWHTFIGWLGVAYIVGVIAVAYIKKGIRDRQKPKQ